MSFYLKGGDPDGVYALDILHEDGSKYHWNGTGRTWGHRDGDQYGLPRQYEVIDFNGYGRTTAGSYPCFDDCYSAEGSNCRARVEIGNNSNYASCTDRAICGPTSWSSSSITAKCNVGGLGGGDWYLFVINGNDVQSTGYKVN